MLPYVSGSAIFGQANLSLEGNAELIDAHSVIDEQHDGGEEHITDEQHDAGEEHNVEEQHAGE